MTRYLSLALLSVALAPLPGQAQAAHTNEGSVATVASTADGAGRYSVAVSQGTSAYVFGFDATSGGVALTAPGLFSALASSNWTPTVTSGDRVTWTYNGAGTSYLEAVPKTFTYDSSRGDSVIHSQLPSGTYPKGIVYGAVSTTNEVQVGTSASAIAGFQRFQHVGPKNGHGIIFKFTMNAATSGAGDALNRL